MSTSTSLIITMLSTSVLSFTLGVAATIFVLYCYRCTMARHRQPSTSLISRKLQRATTSDSGSAAVQTSEYQHAPGPVYQEVKVPPACPQGSINLESDVPLKQNSAYGHIHNLKVSTLGDKTNKNNDCVIFNPIYSCR